MKQNQIQAMHSFCKNDIICNFILKDGFLNGVKSSPDYHFHSFFEIHYAAKGKIHMVINDRDIELREGDLCIIPPNMVHFVHGDELSYGIGFRFSFTCAKNNQTEGCFDRFQGTYGSLQEALIVSDVSLFQHCLHASREAFSNHSPEYIVDDLLFLAIDCLTYRIGENNIFPEKTEYKYSDSLVVEYIEDYLNMNYRSAPRMEELAMFLGLSVRQTQRIIQRLFGKTFSELLALKRLTVAKYLLRTTNMSVDEIAYNSGFCDKQYLYRKFSKFYAMTPVQYRIHNSRLLTKNE